SGTGRQSTYRLSADADRRRSQGILIDGTVERIRRPHDSANIYGLL
ncbi:MAG: hypothetical protein ACI91T_002858, partial [Natronomonas sp.]